MVKRMSVRISRVRNTVHSNACDSSRMVPISIKSLGSLTQVAIDPAVFVPAMSEV